MSKEIVKPIPESPYLSPTTRQEKHAGSRHRRVVNGPSRRGFDGRQRKEGVLRPPSPCKTPDRPAT